jgi:cytochrome c553
MQNSAAMMKFRLTTMGLTLVAAVAAASASSGALRADTAEDKAALCAGCHGENGTPQDPLIPIIWGQKEGYLYLQLRDFKRGSRQNEQMAAVVEGLEGDDMLALAALFSQRPWPDLRQGAAPDSVTAQAVRTNIAVGCTGCHLDHYQGDSTVPRLAGQSEPYLTKTLADFRARTRGNNPGMSDLMNATSEPDLAAMAKYLAGL